MLPNFLYFISIQRHFWLETTNQKGENMALFQNELDEADILMDTRMDIQLTQLFKDTKLTLSVAESITGGMVSQRLSNLSGSSTFFHGGLVCYHPLTIVNLAQVSPATIKMGLKNGKGYALEMARGVNNLIKTDIALSTSALSGPESDKSEQNIFIGFKFGKIEKAIGIHFAGSKKAIREKTTQSALAFLKQNILNWLKESNIYQEENA
ncbi:MAG: nicotinamide-nucleotide amidase [Candidatus Marinamargulisbacteria bacterium]